MPRRTNITQCECDRCEYKEILDDDSPTAADWHDVDRITAEGKARHMLLCKGCYEKYKDLVNKEDTQYRLFMGESTNYDDQS